MLFELPRFAHADAKSVEEAAACLRACEGKARVIGGGTDLLALMKERIEGPKLKSPEVLVNVKTIPEMTRISYDETTGLSLGAAVTLHRIETSEVVRERAMILPQAAREVGTTQLRNAGTLGGNLCQRLRCPYFRHGDFVCLKKGGTRCYAVAGEHRFHHSIFNYGRCVAAHPSDMAPALVALRAVGVIAGSEGKRRIALSELFAGPESIEETVLWPYEFLVAVEVPDCSPETRQIFLKQRIRRAADFALASVAAAARISDGVCKEIRIVLGGVAPRPYIAAAAEGMLFGRSLDPKVISEAAEAAVEGARPLPQNHYKINLTKALVRRALAAVMGHESPAGVL